MDEFDKMMTALDDAGMAMWKYFEKNPKDHQMHMERFQQLYFGILIRHTGSWSLRSETDPKWNRDGTSDLVGNFSMPKECEEAFENLKKELGDPPKDLTWSYMKD